VTAISRTGKVLWSRLNSESSSNGGKTHGQNLTQIKTCQSIKEKASGGTYLWRKKHETKEENKHDSRICSPIGKKEWLTAKNAKELVALSKLQNKK